MKNFITMALLFIIGGMVTAQDQNLLKYSSTITKDDLKKHLSIIASDEYEGRNTGDLGLEKAARYLEKEFGDDGLKGPVNNPKNPFYQEFELEKKSWITQKMIAGKNTFENGNELVFIELTEGEAELEIVFGGYGIFSDKYNDYTNIDVKGKLVAFYLGEPKTKKGTYLMSGTDSATIKTGETLDQKFQGIQMKIMASMMRGAKGFILIEPDKKEAAKTLDLLNKYFGGAQIGFPGKSGGSMIPFPFIYMSPSGAAKLFGTNLKKMEKAVSEKIEKSISPAGLYSTKAKFIAEKKKEKIFSGNVLAVLEGSDKKDEYLIITAHYDHDGVKKGDIYNGADDNGSGTVALIELAEAFAMAKADGFGPRRSIIFAAVTGEEKGLLGSQYYAENPVLPLSNTVTNLNIDMIGRVDKLHTVGNYIHIIASDKMSKELHEIHENTAKMYSPDLKLDYTYNDVKHPENMNDRSDHASFTKKGIPAIFYFSGLHDDYHTPNDDVDKIDFEAYEKRARLIFATAWNLANADERVKIGK